MRAFYVLTTIAFLCLAWFLSSQVISPMFLDSKPEETWTCGTVGPSPKYQHPDAPEALELFKSNCARCHSLNFNMHSTGPALGYLVDRVPSRQWVFEFLRDPEEMLQGDGYALKLYEQYNDTAHPNFDHLSDQEVQLITDFILG